MKTVSGRHPAPGLFRQAIRLKQLNRTGLSEEKMKIITTLTCLGALVSTTSALADDILFIGNSFTFGWGSPVRHYRPDTVTDLNSEGTGGVPDRKSVV